MFIIAYAALLSPIQLYNHSRFDGTNIMQSTLRRKIYTATVHTHTRSYSDASNFLSSVLQIEFKMRAARTKLTQSNLLTTTGSTFWTQRRAMFTL